MQAWRAQLHIMQTQPEWTDIRFFLEVARTGTIKMAGERLGVEHTTVSRRIDRLEASLDAVLFDRRRNGYLLTDAGRALVPHAEQMENALLGAVEESSRKEQGIVGTVRVGTPEAFGIQVLAPSLVALSERQPGLHIELMAQPQFPSLVSREVEILVTLEPPEMGRYKVARLAEVEYFLYGSPRYLEASPPILQMSDLSAHQFIDYIHDGSVSQRYRVLEEITPRPNRSFTSTSVLAQREAARQGMGLILMTPYVAMGAPELVRLFSDRPLITRTLWLAAPEDLFRSRKIRLAWDFIRDIVAERPELLKR